MPLPQALPRRRLILPLEIVPALMALLLLLTTTSSSGLAGSSSALETATVAGVTFEPPVFIGAGAPHDRCQGFDFATLSCGPYLSVDPGKSWQSAPSALTVPNKDTLRVNASGPTGPSTELVGMGNLWGDALDWAAFKCEKAPEPQPKHAQYQLRGTFIGTKLHLHPRIWVSSFCPCTSNCPWSRYVCNNFTEFYSKTAPAAELIDRKVVNTTINHKNQTIVFGCDEMLY